MKVILLIDEKPKMCIGCPLNLADSSIVCRHTWTGDTRPSCCPLSHPLKSVSNDFYIYDRKYLMGNLDREIELLKEVKKFESNTSD